MKAKETNKHTNGEAVFMKCKKTDEHTNFDEDKIVSYFVPFITIAICKIFLWKTLIHFFKDALSYSAFKGKCPAYIDNLVSFIQGQI